MTASGPLVLGLDVGTSAVKAAVFGPGGRVGPVERRAVQTSIPEPGRAIQDPDALRDTVLGVLAAVVARVEGRVDAVALSTAMHAVVGFGPRGTLATPLITWADDRAARQVAAWKRSADADFVHGRTGVPLHPMAPLAKLAWFATSDPATFARVALWADLKALVLWWLTGEVVTEFSSASGWGMMDIRSGAWDTDALGLAGVDETVLPAIATPTTRRALLPDVADRLGIDRAVPIVLGGADGPLANVGAGALDPGVVGLSLGTSGAVRVVVDSVPDEFADLFCYALTDERWVCGGAVSNGGNVVDWLGATFLAGRADSALADAVLDLAATAPPGCDGLVMVPYLVGERAPVWDATIPGAYLGLRAEHGPAHFARAALEGVSAGLGVVVDRIAQVTGVTRVRATGGTLRHPLWRDLIAAAVARPMAVANTDEGSALGAAAMGVLALGAATDLAAARRLLSDDETAEPVHATSATLDAARRTRYAVASLIDGLAGVAAAIGDPSGSA